MKKRFKKIYIEITNCCNRSCSFCPPTRRPPGFMSVTHFRHILREIRPWTDYIYLHVKGEPLLHPQLNQILAAAAGEKIYVNLTTNGTLLARQQETLLRYPIRQINISLHSFESGGTDAFNDYIHSRGQLCPDIFSKTRHYRLSSLEFSSGSKAGPQLHWP